MENLNSDRVRQYSATKGDRAIRSRQENAFFDVFFLPIRALALLPFLTTGAKEEARRITVTKNDIKLVKLPKAFDRMTVAFLTDFHCSSITPPDFVNQIIDETNRLKPDLVLLGGDYVTQGKEYLQPIATALGRLSAPLGVYGVLGNHDHWGDPSDVRSALRRAGVVDLTNAGRWLTINGSRIRVAGVGDLWREKQDLDAALAGAKETDAVILLSHNPDYAMEMTDRRVGLMLSGHTHGGQICLPKIGALLTNSKYGKRLVSGLVDLDPLQLYVSRGLGTVVVPMRFQCPPEISILTLRAGD